MGGAAAPGLSCTARACPPRLKPAWHAHACPPNRHTCAGGEYGIDWRNAGSVHNKQNVFDDFQACAEHLHAAGYSSPRTLAIQVGIVGRLQALRKPEACPSPLLR